MGLEASSAAREGLGTREGRVLREALAESELEGTCAGTEGPRRSRPRGTSGWKPLSFGEKNPSPLETLSGRRPAGRRQNSRGGQELGAPRVAMETDAAQDRRPPLCSSRLPWRGLHLFLGAPGGPGGSSGFGLRAPPTAYLLRRLRGARVVSRVGPGSRRLCAGWRPGRSRARGGGRGAGPERREDGSTQSTRKRGGGWPRSLETRPRHLRRLRSGLLCLLSTSIPLPLPVLAYGVPEALHIFSLFLATTDSGSSCPVLQLSWTESFSCTVSNTVKRWRLEQSPSLSATAGGLPWGPLIKRATAQWSANMLSHPLPIAPYPFLIPTAHQAAIRNVSLHV